MVAAARWGIGLLLLAACSERALEIPLQAVHPDLGRQDLAVPMDLEPPDFAVPMDLARADLASRDMRARDLSARDLALRDLAGRDLLPQPPVCSTVMVTTHAGLNSADFMNGIAVDAAGYIYIGEWQAERILKIAPDGSATTLAGNGGYTAVDGTGGANGTAQFHHPYDLQFGRDGYLYVADADDYRIRKLAPDGTTTTLAGNGMFGYFDGTGGFNGTTELGEPTGLAVDAAGNVYIADYWASRIRKVAPDGSTTTLAGNGTAGHVDGSGGPNGTTQFTNPVRVAVDGAGNLYVSEQRFSASFPYSDNFIRKVAPDGTTTTLAGNGSAGFVDGPAGSAEFNVPFGVTVDAAGNVYVADYENNAIRKVAPDGTTTTLAGGTSGHIDGDGCSARFNLPSSITLSGNQLFVIDEPQTDGGYIGEIRVIQLP